MRIPNGFLGRAKQVVHGIIALLTFIAWAIAIAVFTKPGGSSGGIDFYWFLCWLSIPALVYNVAVPLFPRSRRFANTYVTAVIDILFTICWFSAFIAVSVWVNHGISAGEAKKNDKGAQGCPAFDYGSESKCTLGKTTVDVGVIIFLLYLASTAISVYSAVYLRRNGHLPNARPTISEPTSVEAQKYAFSSNPNDDIDQYHSGDDGENGHYTSDGPPRGDRDDVDGSSLLHTETNEGLHPGRPLSWGQDAEPMYDATNTASHYDQRNSNRISMPPAGAAALDHHDIDTSYHSGGAYDAPIPQLPAYRSPSPMFHNVDEADMGSGGAPGEFEAFKPSPAGLRASSPYGGAPQPPVHSDPFRDPIAHNGSNDHPAMHGTIDPFHDEHAHGGGPVEFPEGDYHR